MIDVAEQTPDRGLRWFNSPVQVSKCRLPEVFKHVPDFERRTLAAMIVCTRSSYAA